MKYQVHSPKKEVGNFIQYALRLPGHVSCQRKSTNRSIPLQSHNPDRPIRKKNYSVGCK